MRQDVDTTVTAVKTLLFTVLVPGTVIVVVPYRLLRASHGFTVSGAPGFRWLALPLLLLGMTAYLWCALEFVRTGRGTPAPIDPPTALVMRGLYRFSRNPMYVGVLAMLFSEAIFFASFSLLLYALGALACFHLFIIAYEEPALRRKFGSAFEQYRRTVPRWLGRARRG